jgi:hypothetical protein
VTRTRRFIPVLHDQDRLAILAFANVLDGGVLLVLGVEGEGAGVAAFDGEVGGLFGKDLREV